MKEAGEAGETRGRGQLGPAGPGQADILEAPGHPEPRSARDARKMGVGWVLVWTKNPVVVRYLADTGFRLDYQADAVAVYRPA